MGLSHAGGKQPKEREKTGREAPWQLPPAPTPTPGRATAPAAAARPAAAAACGGGPRGGQRTGGEGALLPPHLVPDPVGFAFAGGVGRPCGGSARHVALRGTGWDNGDLGAGCRLPAGWTPGGWGPFLRREAHATGTQPFLLRVCTGWSAHPPVDDPFGTEGTEESVNRKIGVPEKTGKVVVVRSLPNSSGWVVGEIIPPPC